jgi:hypothetical protein
VVGAWFNTCYLQTTYESALCSVFTLWQDSMSFISVEPQSRVLLESHTNSLLAQFDTQLRILADRYLAFFRERCIKFSPGLTFHTNIQSSGEESRQHSPFFCRNLVPSILTDSFKVSSLYGTSIARQKLLMPQSTFVVNQLRREQHGIM